jgi:hypothetical protein
MRVLLLCLGLFAAVSTAWNVCPDCKFTFEPSGTSGKDFKLTLTRTGSCGNLAISLVFERPVCCPGKRTGECQAQNVRVIDNKGATIGSFPDACKNSFANEFTNPVTIVFPAPTSGQTVQWAIISFGQPGVSFPTNLHRLVSTNSECQKCPGDNPSCNGPPNPPPPPPPPMCPDPDPGCPCEKADCPCVRNLVTSCSRSVLGDDVKIKDDYLTVRVAGSDGRENNEENPECCSRTAKVWGKCKWDSMGRSNNKLVCVVDLEDNISKYKFDPVCDGSQLED